MTRINLVPPGELTDQHLFAEFREMKMVPKSLRRSLAAAWQREFDKDDSRGSADLLRDRAIAAVLSRIPAEYTLGTGHVSFFYDKANYLRMRYSDVCRELIWRGVDYNRNSLLDPDRIWMTLPIAFHKDYEPTPEALVLIRERIGERIAKQPEWYKFHGAPCVGQNWSRTQGVCANV